jgi:hypothetical protein
MTDDPIDTYTTPRLEAEFRHVMVELTLVSHSSAAPIGRDGPRPVPKSNPPRGYNGKAEVSLNHRWQACRTDEDRRGVLRAAIRRLNDIRYSPAPESKPGTREWKRAIATDERGVSVVARVYRIAEPQVRKLRRQLRAGELNA